MSQTPGQGPQPRLSQERSLHHVGVIVGSIAESVQAVTAALGLSWDGVIHYDPVQTVRVTFLQDPGSGVPSIELVEPAGQESRVSAFLRRGGGLHHLCYEVDDIQLELDRSLASGCILLAAPCPAVAFGGRSIAWICTPDRVLVEYLQRAF